MESIFSWLLIQACICLYIPLMSHLLVIVQQEKEAVELQRVVYEQVMMIKEEGRVDSTWQTAGMTFVIKERNENAYKGIVVYGDKKEAAIQLQSFQINQ